MLASGNITIGDHRGVVHVGGLTIDLDVVWTTLIAAGIVLALGFRHAGARSRRAYPGSCSSSGRPIIEQVSDLADSAIGPAGSALRRPWRQRRSSSSSSATGSPSSPAGIRGSSLRPPVTSTSRWPWPSRSSSWCTTTRSRTRGVKGYFKHYATPYAALDPDQHHRGDHQADHADLPALRQHLLGRADDHRDRHADPALPVLDRLSSSGSRSTNCSSARSRPSSSPCSRSCTSAWA